MNIPLSKSQREILNIFYSLKKEKVILDKKARDKLYKLTKNREHIDNMDFLKISCPALEYQIRKSYEIDNKNIQQAIFSECIYSQALANIFSLIEFHNCFLEQTCIPNAINNLIKSYGLNSRFMYCNRDKTIMLIQAGSCNGVDSALIYVKDLSIYTIEFKERQAKTGENDLPKYDESGRIKDISGFIKQHPKYKMMLNEQKELIFFEHIGHNINNFSIESIKYAVSNSYVDIRKYADVICSEDTNSYLIMFPANQINLFADLYGEIRPAGRNTSSVYTPKALIKFLQSKNAIISKEIITIDKKGLISKVARGGKSKIINRYGINSLFFVYTENCKINGDNISFNINDIRQLIPTIASKISMKDEIKYDDFKKIFK